MALNGLTNSGQNRAAAPTQSLIKHLSTSFLVGLGKLLARVGLCSRCVGCSLLSDGFDWLRGEDGWFFNYGDYLFVESFELGAWQEFWDTDEPSESLDSEQIEDHELQP